MKFVTLLIILNWSSVGGNTSPDKEEVFWRVDDITKLESLPIKTYGDSPDSTQSWWVHGCRVKHKNKHYVVYGWCSDAVKEINGAK